MAPHAVQHLAVEATRLLQEKRGIGRYVRNVVRELVIQQPTLRLTVFVSDEADVAPMTALLDGLHPMLLQRATVDTVAHLPETTADVVWYPWNFITVPAVRAAMVVTIHDLAPMLCLDGRWWKVLKRFKYRRRYERTVHRAHGILTDSAFSRREMADHLGISADRVTITLLAADDLPITGQEDAGPLEQAGVTGAFFLSVGAQDARKNLCTLYRAMDQLWARGHRVPLVQCGPSISRETRALIGKVPWLVHLGYVTDAQLTTLYRRTTALVFPSRYEGFGLPVAEAMRLGAPVICAAGSSLAEVAGPSALLVPWQRTEGFTDEMQRLLLSPALREELHHRSLAQATQYSWARTTRETYAAFDRIVRERPLSDLARRERAAGSAGASAAASAALATGTPVTATSRLHELSHG